MYALFSTGGNHYRATTSDHIKVEKLDVEKGATVELDRVLMVGEGDDVDIGAPYIDGGKVTATVVEHGRGEKVKIVKFKRRKNHMKRQGHRQYFTTLEITGIKAAAPKPEKAEAAAVPRSKKAPAKKAAGKKAASKKTAAKKKAVKKTEAKKAEAKETQGEG
jgi:large subunit ribosomal protein L21